MSFTEGGKWGVEGKGARGTTGLAVLRRYLDELNDLNVLAYHILDSSVAALLWDSG